MKTFTDLFDDLKNNVSKLQVNNEISVAIDNDVFYISDMVIDKESTTVIFFTDKDEMSQMTPDNIYNKYHKNPQSHMYNILFVTDEYGCNDYKIKNIDPYSIFMELR